MRYWRRGPTTCQATETMPSACRDSSPPPTVSRPRVTFDRQTTTPEIDDAQPQADHGHLSTFVDESHRHASRTSRSPSAASEAAPAAEYQEWPFQGFLKRIRTGDDVTYNLEFKLPSISEHLHLPIDPAALDINHDAAVHSKIHRRSGAG
jgi:hypothetical protein